MKRSTLSLSALLIGLSVTTASASAFAAPASTPSTPTPAGGQKTAQRTPKKAAKAKPAEGSDKVQPTDPPATPPEGGAAPAAPTTAPADPAEPTADPAAPPATPPPAPPPAAAPAVEPAATPAVTIGTNLAPAGSDAPQTAPKTPADKPKMRRWAGSQIFALTSASTATFIKSQQQDYNPTVDSSIWLQPRFALSESFQLRGLSVFQYEYTNSDTTVSNHEPRFLDTSVGLWYRSIPKIPGIGVKPMISANLGLPTSPESRARTLVVSPGATLQLVKEFEHVLGGDITLINSTIYSHPLYRYTTPEVRNTDNAPAVQCAGSTCGGQLVGTTNPSDQLSYSLIVSGEWGKFGPAIMYRGVSQWTYHPKAAEVNGQPVSSPNSPTAVRQTSYFSAWLDYSVNSWFTGELGYWMLRSVLDEDGSRGSPFFNRYQDMRVYLGINLNVDGLMKSLEGGATDGGIVRAKNNKMPKSSMFTF